MDRYTQQIASANDASILNTETFAFFRGINAAPTGGVSTADVPGKPKPTVCVFLGSYSMPAPILGGLKAGTYRLCSITCAWLGRKRREPPADLACSSAAANHQMTVAAVAQRGATDDCVGPLEYLHKSRLTPVCSSGHLHGGLSDRALLFFPLPLILNPIPFASGTALPAIVVDAIIYLSSSSCLPRNNDWLDIRLSEQHCRRPYDEFGLGPQAKLPGRASRRRATVWPLRDRTSRLLLVVRQLGIAFEHMLISEDHAS